MGVESINSARDEFGSPAGEADESAVEREQAASPASRDPLWRHIRRAAALLVPAAVRLLGRTSDLFRRGAHGREGRRLLARLEAELPAVAAISPRAERQFLDFGQRLAEITPAADGLVEQSRRVMATALGHDGSEVVFREAAGLLRRVTAEEAGECESTRALARELEHCAATMRQFDSLRSELDDAMAILRIVQVLMRTESAHLADEVRAMFLDLSGQTLALESEINAAFSTRLEAVAEMRRRIESILPEIARQEAARSAKAEAARKSIDVSLDRVAGEMRNNQSRQIGLGTVTEDLAGHVERLVMGLQTHDIVSQKLEHVVGALADLKREDAEGRSDTWLIERLHRFASVEAKQIEAVEGDLARAIETVGAAAHGILELVRTLSEESVLLKSFGDITSSAADLVQVLLDAFESTREVRAAGAADAATTREAIATVSDTTAGLNEAMLSVADRIRLVALNAQIVAIQKGQGTGLEVLAARAAEISSTAEEVGERVSAAVDDVARRIGGALEGFAALEARLRADADSITGEGAEHEQRVHAVRDSMLNALYEVGTLADRIRASAQPLIEAAELLAEPLEVLGRVRAVLDEVAETTGRRLKRRISEDERAGWIERRYTMQAERHVHETAIHGEIAEAGAMELAPGDVELF